MIRVLLLALSMGAAAGCAAEQGDASRPSGIVVQVHHVDTAEEGMTRALRDCAGYARRPVFDHMSGRTAYYRCEIRSD